MSFRIFTKEFTIKYPSFATYFDYLEKNSTIKKFFALSLMLVFAISITPRLFLHDIFAGHIDSTHHCSADGKSMGCIHAAGFSCQQDSPVVNSSYHSPSPISISAPSQVNILQHTLLFSSLPSSQINVKESRGPPREV